MFFGHGILGSRALAKSYNPLATSPRASPKTTAENQPAKSAGTIIQGENDPAGAAAQLVKLLREEAKAI